ncbi:MAG TPA: hypothetical protein VJ729_14045 [Nitrososphaeraceae archaeon]|nr:hypothetical protein [Nitrososphaeraceae archaeon]
MSQNALVFLENLEDRAGNLPPARKLTGDNYAELQVMRQNNSRSQAFRTYNNSIWRISMNILQIGQIIQVLIELVIILISLQYKIIITTS